jgi:hypothetical protein
LLQDFRPRASGRRLSINTGSRRLLPSLPNLQSETCTLVLLSDYSAEIAEIVGTPNYAFAALSAVSTRASRKGALRMRTPVAS